MAAGPTSILMESWFAFLALLATLGKHLPVM